MLHFVLGCTILFSEKEMTKMTHSEMILKIKEINEKNSIENKATEKQISYFAKLVKVSKLGLSLYPAGFCPYQTKLNLMIEMDTINKKGLSKEIQSEIESKQEAYIQNVTSLYS